MTFSDALTALKDGKQIKRRGWNGKEQYLELARSVTYLNPKNELKAPIQKAIAFIGTSGIQVGWLASQADMLTDDWEIVE